MRRALLPVLLLAAMTILALTATAAQSSASTCATHQLALTSWSVQDDHINTSYDFQCGGANNDDYYVNLSLDKKLANGDWALVGCDNGSSCSVSRPSFGYYDAGTEHSGTNTWNVLGQIDCKTFRFHAAVHFRSFPSDFIVYNSVNYNISGC